MYVGAVILLLLLLLLLLYYVKRFAQNFNYNHPLGGLMQPHTFR
jgi:flagellar biogenesis protein FliO